MSPRLVINRPTKKDINILKLKDFFIKLGVLIDGDFKFGVLLLVFVRFLGGDTGNLYQNGFFVKSQCQSPFPLSLES
jgi:hypothetical protein